VAQKALLKKKGLNICRFQIELFKLPVLKSIEMRNHNHRHQTLPATRGR